jgi:hypothetical protein
VHPTRLERNLDSRTSGRPHALDASDKENREDGERQQSVLQDFHESIRKVPR